MTQITFWSIIIRMGFTVLLLSIAAGIAGWLKPRIRPGRWKNWLYETPEERLARRTGSVPLTRYKAALRNRLD